MTPPHAEELPTLVLRGLESDARMASLDATQRFLQAHQGTILVAWWIAWGAVALLMLTRLLLLPALRRLRRDPPRDAPPTEASHAQA